MREILFRGKTENGEWYEGSLLKETVENANEKKDIYRIKEFNIGFLDDWTFEPTYTSGFDEEVIPETVGQYTGLTDKNGKKIFEGDIISFKEEVAEYDYQNPILNFDTGRFRLPEIRKKENRVGVVKWCGNLLQYRVFFNRNCGTSRYELGDHRLEELLVIGNVHDNPELLKGGE